MEKDSAKKIFNQPLEYEIVRSKRTTSSISINKMTGKITVRASFSTPEQYIANFVKSKTVWLRKHLFVIEKNKKILNKLQIDVENKRCDEGKNNANCGVNNGWNEIQNSCKNYEENQCENGCANNRCGEECRDENSSNNSKNSNNKIIYLGEEYSIKIQLNVKDRVEIDESLKQVIIFTLHTKKGEHISKLIYKFYFSAMENIVKERLSYCLKFFENIKSPHVILKKMKSKFGHYSHSRYEICINILMVKLPIYCIDYVITHELCHIFHQNHGRDFYKLLNSKIKNGKKIDQELKEKSFLIF